MTFPKRDQAAWLRDQHRKAGYHRLAEAFIWAAVVVELLLAGAVAGAVLAAVVLGARLVGVGVLP